MKVKAFVIDDDNLSLFLAETVLNFVGFPDEVDTFLEAEEALEEFIGCQDKNELPQVVFLDLNMPVMDGWQFLEQLSEYGEKLKGVTEVYILTSSVDPKDEERSHEYWLVAGFLQKPLRAEVLHELKR